MLNMVIIWTGLTKIHFLISTIYLCEIDFTYTANHLFIVISNLILHNKGYLVSHIILILTFYHKIKVKRFLVLSFYSDGIVSIIPNLTNDPKWCFTDQIIKYLSRFGSISLQIDMPTKEDNVLWWYRMVNYPFTVLTITFCDIYQRINVWSLFITGGSLRVFKQLNDLDRWSTCHDL